MGILPPLSATKTYAPHPGPFHVARPRLIEKFERGARGRLTLVSAGAGSGKSTAVGEWLAATGRRAAWLTLDGGDADFARLVTGMVGAVREVFPDFGAEVLEAAWTPQRPLPALLDDLAAAFRTLPPWTLVLDDAQALGTEEWRALLKVLIEQPPGFHLVLATREDPPLPLARMRASGQLVELRGSDLNFAPDEAGRFLNGKKQLGLTAAQLGVLADKTEGWAGGLQMAALSLETTRDRDAFLASFSGTDRAVLDYLLEEVLQGLPGDLQDFLSATAVLDKFCGQLCEAVLGLLPGQGQQTLLELESRNLFLVPLDRERHWYRYHSLLGDLLRQRLRDHEGLRRASAWFEGQNMDLEAFQYAVKAGDTDRAATLAEGPGMPLIFRGGAVPVLTWLGALAPAELDRRPVLWVLYASCLLFVSRLEGVEHKLAQAQRVLESAGESEYNRNLTGHIAAVRATLGVLFHQPDQVARQSARALEFLSPANLPVRAASVWTQGVALQWRGDSAGARRCFVEALEASRPIGHFIITVMASVSLAQVDETEGRFTEAEALYRQVLVLAGRMTVACQPWLGLGRMALARGRLTEARDCADKALAIARLVPGTDPVLLSLLLLVKITRAEGGETEHLLQEAKQLLQAYRLTHCQAEYDAVAAAEHGLSGRECEVLALIAQGLSNEDIAERLFLALSSVKGHNQRIFEKLGVARRTEAVAKARALGLVP